MENQDVRNVNYLHRGNLVSNFKAKLFKFFYTIVVQICCTTKADSLKFSPFADFKVRVSPMVGMELLKLEGIDSVPDRKWLRSYS